ncbi:MAG: DUF362 domain-containing protein [Opitutaceae bacterium]|nr:DUF362 domain-containing protein [Opitutaceae bacterium]
MKSRREFLKTGLAFGALFSTSGGPGLFANQRPAVSGGSGGRPVLVAVRDGERTAMLDRALAELGGIEAFVQPGQTVLIKPNIGWDVPPERGGNTHPEIVARLVTLCLTAGAKSVSVFDNPCDQWQRCYVTSGIAAAAEAAGARVVNGKDESLYREIEIPQGVKLRQAKVHALVLDSDVFINVPVLKHHSGALMTAAMKNLMGVVWDRRFYHRNDMPQCIADFVTTVRPTLNIIDAYHPMVRNGPRGLSDNDVVLMRTLLASTDIVAIDAAAARLLGHAPADVRHVQLAADMQLGTIDFNAMDIRRLQLA